MSPFCGCGWANSQIRPRDSALRRPGSYRSDGDLVLRPRADRRAGFSHRIAAGDCQRNWLPFLCRARTPLSPAAQRTATISTDCAPAQLSSPPAAGSQAVGSTRRHEPCLASPLPGRPRQSALFRSDVFLFHRGPSLLSRNDTAGGTVDAKQGEVGFGSACDVPIDGEIHTATG